MRRSEINTLMRDAVEFFATHRFHLPPFAVWRSADWASWGSEAEEIRRSRLGWDVTDFGSGDFERIGLLLFTLRNGRSDEAAVAKTYAEKVMIVGEGQMTPWHYHARKMEDIVNRGAARLVIELNGIGPEGNRTRDDVRVMVDGIRRRVPAGGRIELAPGESITLVPRLAHQFRGAGGRVLVGEVSSVNDDDTDNYFLEPRGRFPPVEEDEEPLYRLCSE